MNTLTPIKRRIVYVTVFEILAILFSTFILMLLSGRDAVQSLPVAMMVSGAAVVWNFLYNSVFEAIEKRWQIHKRTLIIRAFHALGFEGGLDLDLLAVIYAVVRCGAVDGFYHGSGTVGVFLSLYLCFYACF